MKTLYVVRHAKSSWDDSSLADFDRPLNERGKADAPRMGKRLKEKEIAPDFLLSSPAKRAHSTAKRIAEALNFPKDNIKTDRKLYHADADEILDVVRGIPDKHNSVFIFGHNPGLTDFVNTMIHDRKEFIDNVPTCGIVAFNIPVDSWKKMEFGKGDFLFFDYPKKT
jgi:phosphohistidine phosphatase